MCEAKWQNFCIFQHSSCNIFIMRLVWLYLGIATYWLSETMLCQVAMCESVSACVLGVYRAWKERPCRLGLTWFSLLERRERMASRDRSNFLWSSAGGDMDQAENSAGSLPSIICLKEKVVKSTITNNILMDASKKALIIDWVDHHTGEREDGDWLSA